MTDEMQAESSTAETETQHPETDGGEDIIFAAESKPAGSPDGEESATSDQPESQDETSEASETSKSSGKETKGAEQRIKQLTAKVKTLERKLTESNQQRPQATKITKPTAPKLEDYDDITRFNEDLTKHEEAVRKYAVEEARIQAEQKAADEKQKAQTQEQVKAWNKKAADTLKRDPDFDTMPYFDAVQPTPPMDALMQDSDIGPDLLSYLNANPDEADRLRELPPIKAIREMIKLESQISNRIKGIKPKESASKTKPPGYVRGSAAPTQAKSAADLLYG